MEELVSILIPAYNCEKWISDAVKSALNQTWKNKEIIIVNDGSTDNTQKVIESFSSKKLKIIKQENSGQCNARNVALSHAQGDYIQWLDADDILSPEKLSLQMKYADRKDHLTLLSSACGLFYRKINKGKFIKNNLWQDLDPLDWLIIKLNNTKTDYIAVHAWLTSRKLINMAGLWDTRLNKTDDDGEYYCRIVSCSNYIKFVPEAKCYYRKSIGNTSLSFRRDDFESELLLKNIVIARMFALDNSERVKNACEKYLQTWIDGVFQVFPNVYNATSQLANKFNLCIKQPENRIVFKLISSIIGLRNTLFLKRSISQVKRLIRYLKEF